MSDEVGGEKITELSVSDVDVFPALSDTPTPLPIDLRWGGRAGHSIKPVWRLYRYCGRVHWQTPTALIRLDQWTMVAKMWPTEISFRLAMERFPFRNMSWICTALGKIEQIP